MAWTKEQALAIATRDRTLLVSAAAGSGKTATLTERIIQSILDDKSPADIGRMLIATYTNAAVDELRERIGRAIKKAARENPDNARLEEQLLRLKDAKILTITSFCNSILRMSAESIGLAPNYRIAEPAEAKILSSSVMEALINAAYEGELCEVCSADEFIALTDVLCSARYSEGLSESFSYVFEKLKSTELGIDTLLPLIEEYNPKKFTSAENTRIGKYITNHTKNAFSEYEKAYASIIKLAGTERIDKKNLPKAESDLAFIREFNAAESYSQRRSVINRFKSASLSNSGREPITDFYVRLKQIRSYLSEDVKEFNLEFYSYSEEEWRDLYAKLYNLLNIFYKFLKKFYTSFMEEKRRRGICEFSDVERYAYEALYNKDGSKSDLAEEISREFDSVYVDEYQDVNALQNKVFSAISRDDNRFMVGDIKQSIYGFRSARPEIFAGMKNDFPILGDDGDYPCASLFMSDNFRCDEGVVDFVNGVFDTMFGLLGGSIGYIPEDKLKFSKIYQESDTPVHHIPEIHIIERPEKIKHAEQSDDASEQAAEENQSNAHIMARRISAKISELIETGTLANGARIEPKDIAILVRSVKGTHSEAIVEELKSIGISSRLTDNSNLFMSNEVLLALSFLYSIDNPKKDVYLVALMCSPIYSFSADEVLKIRKESSADTVWDSLIEYTEKHTDYEKGKRFIDSLYRYRRLAEGMPTDTLLGFIYRESGLLALAAKSGGRDNLILLHSYAAKYEKSDFKGLYSFISYINAVIEKKEEYPAATAPEEANAVSIMTVHKSKGLEFPVTIIANASAKSGGGNEGRVTFSENFGIALKAKDDSGLALVDNPAVNAINHYIERIEFEEELRVLYVALTRARERLYIYATSPKAAVEDYTEGIESLRSIISPYFATKAKSFLDIIMVSKSFGRVFIDPPFKDDTKDITESCTDITDVSCAPSASLSDLESGSLKQKLSERFSFEYPLSYLERVPEKVSISKLSPTVLDENEKHDMPLDSLFSEKAFISDPDRIQDESKTDGTKRQTLPSFMTGTSQKESAKRGIATHMVMQFCDFELLEKRGTNAELARLVSLEFIGTEDAARVRRREIDKFILSPLFKELKEAKQVYRELRFNLKLPAERFTEDSDKKELLSGHDILVQGVIDCIIERADGSLHLVDYKTDRLTKEELLDVELAKARLRSAHSRQLSYYSDAVSLIFGKSPSRVGIYSLHLGDEVALDFMH